MAKETLEFELKADTKTAEKQVKKFEDDIKGFKSRIEDEEALELSLNVGKIQSQLDRVKQELKDVEDEEVKIELLAERARLKQELTQATRELRNYARTGKKDVSVLGKLFQNVSGDIDKTRLEILKLGKSTKVLDKMEKDLDSINREFQEGKINAQQYGVQLNKIQSNIKNSNKSFFSLKKTLAGVSGFLIAGLWVQQLTAFTKESVQAFSAFEKGLARINTVANTTQANMEALGVEIKNVSATFGIAKDQLLETGFNIASAGVEFENVASILRLSAITATGAGTDTTTAFNGIIAVLKKYGENLNQAGAIAEKFFIANKLGQTTIEDLATALLNLSSSAKPAGVTINEVFAILSTLTGVTGNANQVITQLNGAINALSAPTTEASKKFKELGIEVGQSAIEEKGFVTVAKEVFDAVGGNQEALRKLIPEVEASKLIIALATTQNDKYKESLDEVTNGAGNLEEAVKKMSETTDFRLKVAGQKWENFKVKSGQVLITIAGFLLDFGNVIISTFKIFGKVLDQGVNAILWFTDVTISGLADLVFNWKEFARVIPQFVKKAFNELPAIASASLRKFLGIFGDLGADIAEKLNLQESVGEVFEEIDTNFNFKNTQRAFDNLANNAIKNNKAIGDEWENITDIVTGNSKEQQLAIAETIKEVESLDQSFWSLDENAEDQDELTKSIGGTTEALKEQKKAEEEAQKLLEEKQKKVIELGKTNSKVYGEIIDDIEGGVDSLEKYIDGIEKVNDKIEDLKDNATENIREINNSLGELDEERDVALAERFVELTKEEADLRKQLRDEDDSEKRREINKELKELARERQIIEENTTEEQRKQAEALEALSDAERTIQDTANQKKVLEERKKIFEAIQNGEKINLEEIQNFENLKLAESLEAQQTALDTELQALKDNLEQQRVALLKINEEKKAFEADWTKFFGTEIQKQKGFAKELQAELRRIIALQQQAGIEGASFGTPATAEQRERIESSVDNSRNVNVEINATNDIDVDQAVEQIGELIQ